MGGIHPGFARLPGERQSNACGRDQRARGGGACPQGRPHTGLCPRAVQVSALRELHPPLAGPAAVARRSLLGANEPYLHINFACFSRMVEIGRGCEMDGFAFFPSNPGRHFTPEGKKASLHKFSDRAYKEGFALLPEFGAALDKE